MALTGIGDGLGPEYAVRARALVQPPGRAQGVVSPLEAAVALGVTREFVYGLTRDEKLKSVR